MFTINFYIFLVAVFGVLTQASLQYPAYAYPRSPFSLPPCDPGSYPIIRSPQLIPPGSLGYTGTANENQNTNLNDNANNNPNLLGIRSPVYAPVVAPPSRPSYPAARQPAIGWYDNDLIHKDGLSSNMNLNSNTNTNANNNPAPSHMVVSPGGLPIPSTRYIDSNYQYPGLPLAYKDIDVMPTHADSYNYNDNLNVNANAFRRNLHGSSNEDGKTDKKTNTSSTANSPN